MLRSAPGKQLFFDEGTSLIKLFDDFAAVQAKPDKTQNEEHLLKLCLYRVKQPTVSSVPFSHLVASYQAALKDADKTLEIIGRTEYKDAAGRQADTIRRELKFIDRWLDKHAPHEVKFAVSPELPKAELSDRQKNLLSGLADAVEQAEPGQGGQWFHERIYEQKDKLGLEPAQAFQAIYKVILNQDKGPQAGWFLSLMDRDWLISRLRLQA